MSDVVGEPIVTADSSVPRISLKDVVLSYDGSRRVLDGVDLDVEAGEFVSIIGPSGCGKSTLLSIVAGILEPTAGQVLVNGREVEGPGPDRAVVFQDFALMPWKTVRENVMFALRLSDRKRSRREAGERAQRYLEMVGLGTFGNHYPKQLSGGMRQRVGIARALAVEPQILLMDEPFASVDAQSAELLREELSNILTEGTTVFFITHNLDEAIQLSDRLVMLSAAPSRITEAIELEIPRGVRQHVGHAEQIADIRARLWKHLRSEVRFEESRSIGGPRP